MLLIHPSVPVPTTPCVPIKVLAHVLPSTLFPTVSHPPIADTPTDDTFTADTEKPGSLRESNVGGIVGGIIVLVLVLVAVAVLIIIAVFL